MDDRLLEIVREGCPQCGSKDHLCLLGAEAFSQGVSHNKKFDEVCYHDPDVHDTLEAQIVCTAEGCDFTETLLSNQRSSMAKPEQRATATHQYERVILDEEYMLEITGHGFYICPYVYDDLAKEYVENVRAGSVNLGDEAMLKLFAYVAGLITEGKLKSQLGDDPGRRARSSSHQSKGGKGDV